MSLELVWFTLTAAALAAYVVLDGFDLGVGIVHLFVAETKAERRLTMATIGPVWDGNEVCLLAAGGTLVLAFPKMYAVTIGGFYLPVQLLLWLYIGRALGIEMKHHHVGGPLWDELWDAVFAVSSLLIALFLGVALGNVVRGVSFDETGRFFAPLWTTFSPASAEVGILDGYTVLVGAAAVAGLAAHGALWLAHRTEGATAARAKSLAERLLLAVGLLAGATTAATFLVQPRAMEAMTSRPALLVFPASACAALIAANVLVRRGRTKRAFLASAAFLACMLASAAASLYPSLLPAAGGGAGLTVHTAATSRYAMGVGLWWFLPGVALAATYFYRNYRGLPATFGASEPHDD